MSSPEIDRYANWISSEIEAYEVYHSHKENMAWVATALYVPGIISLGYITDGICGSRVADGVATLLLLLVTILVYLFVSMQFTMRWVAADIQAGLMLVMASLCNSLQLPPKDKLKVENDNLWPNFIQERIDQQRKRAPRSKVEGLKAFKNIIRFQWNEDKLDNRWKTELASYVIIALGASLSLSVIWS